MEETKGRFAELEELLKEQDRNTRTGVVMHDSPDHDALAGGFFFKEMLQSMGFDEVYLLFHGNKFKENREFFEKIGLKDNAEERKDVREIYQWDYSQKNKYDRPWLFPLFYDKFIFVDHSGKNSTWYNDGKIKDNDILAIVDHHNCDKLKNPGNKQFFDCRPVGAISTIITEYLKDGAEKYFLPSNLEMLYNLIYMGVNIDTNHLRYGVTDLDEQMYRFVTPKVDYKLTSSFYKAKKSSKFFDAFGWAVHNRDSNKPSKGATGGDYATIASVGPIKGNRSAIPETANFLLQEHGIRTVYLFGFDKHYVDISIRTENSCFDYVSIREMFPNSYGNGRNGAGRIQVPTENFCDKERLENLSQNYDEATTIIKEGLKSKLF